MVTVAKELLHESQHKEFDQVCVELMVNYLQLRHLSLVMLIRAALKR